jgi:acyl-coenzyme A synthetase/AMP-(fatty) acid ligase
MRASLHSQTSWILRARSIVISPLGTASIYGEEIHAAVVPQGDVTAAALQAYCRSRLADFKGPKVIHFVKALPKDSTGKVERLRLTDLVSK